MPTWCLPIFNETNAYWEVQLAATPAELTKSAREKATDYVDQACSLLTMLDKHDPAYISLQHLFVRAKEELGTGISAESIDKIGLSQWARATRAYTRAQVRALQVIQALDLAPEKPEDLDR